MVFVPTILILLDYFEQIPYGTSKGVKYFYIYLRL